MMKMYCSILSMIFLLTLSLSAQETEFTSLFNGNNLDGWVNVNCAPETWAVQDGMITCTGNPYGVLRTDKMYENYILELEYRHHDFEGNAGLFLHADALPAVGKRFPRCIEVQILTDRNTENYTSHGDIFAIQGARMTPFPLHPNKWMRSLPQKRLANPTGEWNHFRVECIDGNISLAVNGEKVTQVFYANPSKGYICLEAEGGAIDFRNIQMQELPRFNPHTKVTACAADGFESLFNGIDLRGWKKFRGNKGHWAADNGVIKYDGKSKAKGENKHLWTEKEYKDFILILDWRFPGEPQIDHVPVVLPDGLNLQHNGEEVKIPIMDAGDSGIYVRGTSKSQINIWNWPVGSGEIWGYRTDTSMSAEVRRSATPIQNADNALGEWNRFKIIVKGNSVTVYENNTLVIDNAELPEMPERGAIALQHHGDPIEFCNIFIKEL